MATAVDTLVLASFYLLLALGFNIVYRASGVVNIVQGQFVVIGGLFLATLSGKLVGHDVSWLAIPITVVTAAVFGLLTYYVFLWRAFALSQWTLVIATLAIANIFDGAISLVWSSQTYYINRGFPAGVVSLDGTRTPISDLVLIGIAIVGFALLALTVQYTKWGARTRAVADNPELAASKGINIGSVMAVSWSLCFAVSALIGVFYGIMNGISASANGLGLAALPAVMLGGMGSILGSAAGAIVIAALVTVLTIHQGAPLAQIVGYLVLLGVLLIRPVGLFGQRSTRSV